MLINKQDILPTPNRFELRWNDCLQKTAISFPEFIDSKVEEKKEEEVEEKNAN